MADLRIHRGITGMCQFLEQQLELLLLAAELQAMAAKSVPRIGVAMLELEDRQQAQGRRLADLAVAHGLVDAHLDAQLRTLSIGAVAARTARSEGGAHLGRACAAGAIARMADTEDEQPRCV